MNWKELFRFLITLLILVLGVLVVPIIHLTVGYIKGDWHPTKDLYEYTDPVCPEGFETFYYNHGTRCRKAKKYFGDMAYLNKIGEL